MSKNVLKLVLSVFFVFIMIEGSAQKGGGGPIKVGAWSQLPSCDSCNGVAYVSLSGYGAGPFYYSWSPAGGTNDTAYNLCSYTTYTITVRDAEENIIATIVITPAPYTSGMQINYTQARCTENCNGSAYISNYSTYGLTILSYDWYPGTPTGDGTDSVSNLCPNQAPYCSVTLSNGCVDTLEANVPPIFNPGAIISFTSAICKDSCDGTASIHYLNVKCGGREGCDTISDDGIVASYYWIPSVPVGDSTADASRLCYGEYTCIVTDTAGCIDTVNYTIDYVTDCVACFDCLSSFAPNPGKKYMISGWVKESGAAATKTSYTYPQITVSCPSVSFTSSAFSPSGRIIDGWQRVEAEFVIPDTATDLEIELSCTTGDCFFDDIRVFPFDGSMKSYVYNPVTMRLVAELDERNYATIYEYDEEGKLTRVKKETEKGVMTIKENRNNTSK